MSASSASITPKRIPTSRFAFSFWLNTRHNNFSYSYHPDEYGKTGQIIGKIRNYHHPLLMLYAADVAARLREHDAAESFKQWNGPGAPHLELARELGLSTLATTLLWLIAAPQIWGELARTSLTSVDLAELPQRRQAPRSRGHDQQRHRATEHHRRHRA